VVKNCIKFFVSFFLFASVAKGQTVELHIGSSANSFFLKSGTTLSVNKFIIDPSADLTITSNQVISSTSLINTSNQPYIPYVYRFSNTVNSFSGQITANYSGVTIPNTITESNLKLKFHDGTSWNTATTASLNTSTDILQTTSLSSVSLNEITLSDVSGSLATTPCAGTLSGTQEICIGSTTTFTSTVSGGTWTSSDPAIATINSSGVISGVSAGTVTITYSYNGTGSCASATSTRTLTVFANPTAGTISALEQLCNLSSIQSSLQNGLLSFYPMCGNLSDVIGGSSLQSTSSTLVQGPYDFSNSAYSFNGTNSEMTIPYQSWYSNLVDNFSLSFWVKNGLSTGHSGAHILWRSDGNLSVLINGNNTLSFNRQGETTLITSTSAISNNWTHIAFVKSGSSNKVYINGALNSDVTSATGLINTVNDAMIVGRASPGGNGGAYRFNGSLAQLMFYSRTLNASEINSIYVDEWNSLCVGSASTITSTVSGGTWNSSAPSVATVDATSGLVTGIAVGSSTLTYTVAGNGGCANASATQLINVTAANTVGAASSTPTLCINTVLTNITHTTTGATGIGTASGLPAGVSAAWASNTITISGTPTQAGTFSYTIPVSGGCGSVSATGTITVSSLPSGTISSNTNILCEGESVNITATGGNTYQWFLNGTLINGVTTSLLSANQPGTYTVNLISSFGCTALATGQVTLQLIQKPIVNFTYDKYCAGFPTQFTDQSTLINTSLVDFSWNFGQGQGTSLLQNPIYTFSTAGTYSVSLTVTPTSCPSLATTVTKPVSTVISPSNQRYVSLNAVENRNLQLTSRSIGSATYQWSPGSGLNSTSIASPVFNYNTEVEYVITITTGIGCVIKDTQLVRIFKEKEIFVPKGFSPNGDGNNDKIFPRLVGVRSLTYFKIFNRWGQLVFMTSNLNEGWDGTYKGIKQSMESYVWVAEGIDIDNNPIKRTGTFLLLR
jgi:gliding motility-associated-like protein